MPVKDEIKTAAGKAAQRARGAIRRVVGYFSGDSLSWLGYARHGANETPDSVLGTWSAPAGTPFADVDLNLHTLRKRSRDLKMGSSFISAILGAKRDGVVGRGIHLDSQLDAEGLGVTDREASAIERRIQKAWAQWERRAGRSGETLTEILSAAYYAAILSGDCFVRVTLNGSSLRLFVIEGDAVQTPPDKLNNPRVRCGVELARASDYPVAYYVVTGAPRAMTYGEQVRSLRFRHARSGYQSFAALSTNGEVQPGEWMPPQEGLLHVHTAFERPGQIRGIPIASSMMQDIKQLDRYVAAEVTAAVVSSKFTVFMKHPPAEVEDFGVFGRPADAPEYAAEVEYDAPVLGDGAIVDLEDGASVESVNPTRPNTAFGGFVDAMQARIAAGLQIPIEVATKKCSSSYSAARAAFLDADRSYSIDRALLIRQLLQPVFEMWLDINADRLGLDGYYTDPDKRDIYRTAEWIGEQVPSIDPVKEVQAAQARMAINVSTGAREARELTGTDIASNIRQRGYEEELLRSYGLVKDNNGNPIQGGSDDSSQEQ